MTAPRKPIRALLFACALIAPAAHALAQAPIVRVPATRVQTAENPAPAPKPRVHKTKPPTASGPGFNPALILLDPAHGGSDPGGQITPDLPEKQVTLDFARRLRTLLAAKGFTVVLTREADPIQQPAPPPDPDNPDVKPVPPPLPPQITLDQRAELANRIRPVACILIHATSSGHGVHLYTSALAPPLSSDAPRDILLWDTAQAPALAYSTRLNTDLNQAIAGLRVPLVTAQFSIRPIDSMTCPAVAIELAPINPNGGASTPVSDEAYQQRVAEAVTTALVFWRTQAQNILDEQAAFAARAAERAAASGAAPKPSEKSTDKSAPKPRPKPSPGSLIPNAPAALPKIPQIPQIPKIVTPRTTPPPAAKPSIQPEGAQ